MDTTETPQTDDEGYSLKPTSLAEFKKKWDSVGSALPAEDVTSKLVGVAGGIGAGVASNAESVARGAAAVVPGQFGDMEAMARKSVNAMGRMVDKSGQQRKTKDLVSEAPVLRTTDEFLKKYPQRFTEETPEAKGMEQLGAALNIDGMERGIRTIAELPGNVMRAGKDFAVAAGETGKSRLLTAPTPEETAVYTAGIAAGKTPEQVWNETKVMKDKNGDLFKRVDDSKAEWRGVEALKAKVPKRTADLEKKEAARVAHTEATPKDGTREEYEKWKEDHDKIEDAADAARALLYSPSSVKGLTLGDVLKHDALYADHPDMANIKVAIGKPGEMKGAYAHYQGGTRTITFSSQTWRDLVRGLPTADRAVTAALHEAQHDIDLARGGMDWGSSVEEVRDARKGVDDATAFKLYQANPGEVRARYAEEGARIPNDQAPYPLNLGVRGSFDLHPSSWVSGKELGARSPGSVGRARPKLSSSVFSMAGAPLAVGAGAGYNAPKPEGQSK